MCPNGTVGVYAPVDGGRDVSFACNDGSVGYNNYYYICGDKESEWGDEEATVICRGLGYSLGTSGELVFQ